MMLADLIRALGLSVSGRHSGCPDQVRARRGWRWQGRVTLSTSLRCWRTWSASPVSRACAARLGTRGKSGAASVGWHQSVRADSSHDPHPLPTTLADLIREPSLSASGRHSGCPDQVRARRGWRWQGQVTLSTSPTVLADLIREPGFPRLYDTPGHPGQVRRGVSGVVAV